MDERPAAAILKPKIINLCDHSAIKRVLDETASEVILSKGYVENVTVSNMKMALGLLTCLVALVAQFYPKKFPENRPLLIVCIGLYVILNGILQLVVQRKEKNHILFTYPFPGSFTSTGLAVSSKLPRHSDTYSLKIASTHPQHIAANAPVEFSKSVTKWFGSDGTFAEQTFSNEVEKLLDAYNSESRKSK